MIDGRTAFFANIPFKRIVTTTNRAFHWIIDGSFLMAPIAPGTACSAIWHVESPLDHSKLS